MPGMFYTLQEVIEKLRKTEAEIKTFVKEGKLREFRDGAKQLYKTEDVEALAATPKGDTAILNDSLQIAIDETGEISLAPEEFDALIGDKQESKSQFKLDETGELIADETLGDTKPQDAAKTKSGSAIPLAPAEPAKEEPAGEITTVFGESKEEKITNDDTRISLGGDSISVLDESDTAFKASEDTSGKTKVVKGKQKPLGEKGKGEAGEARLDEDVNLESFGGSGSGLLDLSLQADDTSLGAVLDDIYPDTPGPGAAAPVEQTPAAPSDAVAQEAEQIFEQAEPEAAIQPTITTEAIPEASSVAVITEAPPDAASNTFGLVLFVPLVVLVYTAIVVISGYKPIANLKILSSLEPIIWYVAAGAAAAVILTVLIGSFMSAGGNKPPKPPKIKGPKLVKEKKAKKGKETPPAKEQ